MADSSVGITSGSGTSIDTRTEATNGNHRQVVVLGDPSTNAGVAPVDATNGLAVDIKAIAAGDNNIGNVDLASAIPAGTNNIGDIDVLSVPADPFGTNADAAATAGSTGSIQAKLRLATSQLDAIKTAVEALDNVVSGSEAQVDVVTLPSDPLGASADAAATAGSTGTLSAKQRLMTSQLDAIKTAVETLDNAISGSEMQVDVVGALPAGTNAIGKLAANSGVDIGDVDVASVPTDPFGANADAASATGSISAKLKFIASTGIPVTGTVTVSDSTAQASLSVMDDWDNAASDGASVSGDVAHDAADAGEPVKIGFKAYAFDGTIPQTASAEADRVNGIADLQGIQYVQVSHPFFWHVSVDYSGAQTNATVKAAPGAGSLYITDIFLSNGAVAGNVTLLDGSGGTVLWEAYPAINGGAVLNLRNPIKLSATTLLAITSTTVTTHSLTVCGFTA